MRARKNKSPFTKTVVVPVTEDVWKFLRKKAFDDQTSINKIVRNAIEKEIKKFERKA